MNQLHKNQFIASARTGFFEQGYSKGTYGLSLALTDCASIGSDELLAVKQIVEEPLPPANRKARIMVPGAFKNRDALRWLLASLARYNIATQVIFSPALGEPELLSIAAWRILQTSEPIESFVDFNELWFIADEKTIEGTFPLWPLSHPAFLYVKGQGLSQESVVGFISRASVPWSLL